MIERLQNLPAAAQWLVATATIGSLAALSLALTTGDVVLALLFLLGGTVVFGLGGYAITTAYRWLSFGTTRFTPPSPAPQASNTPQRSFERTGQELTPRVSLWDRLKPWLAALVVAAFFASLNLMRLPSPRAPAPIAGALVVPIATFVATGFALRRRWTGTDDG